METDDRALVETIVLAIEIEGPGRAPSLFDDFSTTVGDRRLSERLDEALAAPVCPCGRRVKSAFAEVFVEDGPPKPTPQSHVCEIIPFPGRARLRA